MGYQRKDARYRQAKAEGFRARSAYKLIELDRRFRLLRPGATVVDIGAWPGGWMQVAAERVGPRGRVVGVDVAPLEPLGLPQALTLVGDIADPAVVAAVRAASGRAADVVLSDASPKLTGVRARDQAQCEDLTRAVIEAARQLLVPGGILVVKTFMGAGHDEALRTLHGSFDRVRAVRLEATRQGSAESYCVAFGFSPGGCG